MYDIPKIDLKDKVSAQEWQTRIELAACYRLLVLHGWDDLCVRADPRYGGPAYQCIRFGF